MWSLIEETSKTRSVILTSHSLEEAEALCTRVTIMVKGKMLCLGSVQHLKSKFLDGYTIDVHCENTSKDATTEQASADDSSQVDQTVNRILNDTLPGATLAERHGRYLRFDLSSASSLGLGTTFRRMQDLKNNSTVANYSISQCSLEQVFLKLVKDDNALTALTAAEH